MDLKAKIREIAVSANAEDTATLAITRARKSVMLAIEQSLNECTFGEVAEYFSPEFTKAVGAELYRTLECEALFDELCDSNFAGSKSRIDALRNGFAESKSKNSG